MTTTTVTKQTKKEGLQSLRSEIKKLAEGQIVLKNQRKTVNLVGERTHDPSEAQWKHYSNRFKLRMLYLTLGLLRGRTIEQIEGSSKQPLTEHAVKHLLERYGE